MFGPEFTDVAEIGRGAFSTVYRAHSTSFHRDVAIKHFTGRLTDPKLAATFDRECATIGALSHHPNVVTVHGTGRTADERPYIVMQHYPLGSLADIVGRDGPLTVPEILYVAGTIGSALTLSHVGGVIHRDVKPHNILADWDGLVALADFGIARPDTSHATTSVMSTHAFAAPEVLRDGTANISCDVYSFAATLYWLLTGQPPHPPTPGEPELRYLERIVGEPSAPLPETIPAPIATAIQTGLAAAAIDRPVDIDAFLALLDSAAAEAGVQPATTLATHSAAPSPRPAATPTPGPDYAAATTARPTPAGPTEGGGRRRTLLTTAFALSMAAVIALAIVLLAHPWKNDNVRIDNAGAAQPGAPAATSSPSLARTSTPSQPASTSQGGTVTVPIGRVPVAPTTGSRPAVVPKKTHPVVPLKPINNPAPWVAGIGPFSVSLDCGPWRDGTDDHGAKGVQIRSCARRVGQAVAAGMQVQSTDNKRHQVSPAGEVGTCVGGPTNCDDLGPSSLPVFPASVATATVGGDSSWTYLSSGTTTGGPHRCIGVRGALGSSARAASPFRLDWNQVKNDAGIGTTPRWTCPTPPGWA